SAAKVWELKVWPQWPQRKRGMRCGAASRTNEPCRVQCQPRLERWKRQSLRGQCGGTKGAAPRAMLPDHCRPRAANNLHRRTEVAAGCDRGLDTPRLRSHNSVSSWAERSPWQGAFRPDPGFRSLHGTCSKAERDFTSEVSRVKWRGRAGRELQVIR